MASLESGADGCARREPLMSWAVSLIVRWLYSMVMWLLQPLLRRKLLRRARQEPLYGEHIEERFGYYTPVHPAPKGASVATPPCIWVHAVSLGETRAAAALIQQLRVQIPGMRLLLTHGTATGRAQGQSLLQAGDVQVWQPWDTPGAVGRFLQYFQPRIGLLMETEVWPNWVAGCAAAGVPLCLVNARLSGKSLHAAQRMAWLARPAYRALAGVWAQSEDDAARFRQLGASVRGVMGNFKFDVVPDALQLLNGQTLRQARSKPVIMLASSREGEEQMLIEQLALPAMQAALSAVQWLIVPRHPQRFDEVAHLWRQAGYAVSRRSSWGEAGPQRDQHHPGQAPVTVWLGDSLGEMALYYGLADVALLGGSFAPLGGQNLIEAAACACPVVAGPHTFNFAEATQQAVQGGAARQCPDLSSALQSAYAWVQSPAALQQARDAALHWGQQHQGAAERTAAAIRALLGR